MVAAFNSNPSTTIISCYSPTNTSDETDLDTFYNELSSLVRSIPKHHVLMIEGDMNAQMGKNVNNKFSLHNSSNRNGEHLTNFTLENTLTCLKTKFQKRKGKLWTYTYAINAKAQTTSPWIRNGLIALWIVRHSPLLKVCLPTTESSRQRYVLAYAGIRRKQPKPHTMTDPCLTIEILAINIR